MRPASIRLSLVLAAFVAALLLAPVAAAAESIETPPSDVRQYWSEDRMEAAAPVAIPTIAGPGRQLLAGPEAYQSSGNRSLVQDPDQAPVRSHGKVFFTIPEGSESGDYVCSGTLVESNSLSVVWTAGHCVFDSQFGGGFATNWMFVPAYEDGATPYGEWPALELATTPEWKNANINHDFGAAVITRAGNGQGLESIIGARPIAFNQPASQNYEAFGYPASFDVLSPGTIEFDGEREYSCRSPLFARDSGNPQPIAIECDMTGGSSGGGWVGGGAVLSVSSYKYATQPQLLYGSYQGNSAQDLYQEVSGDPVLCAGQPATHFGAVGDDVIRGTSGDDVIAGLGGNDSIRGGGGDDLICGGGGADRLFGGKGDDVLRGQGGEDRLAGGKGRRDLCAGGPGRDTASGCEAKRAIP